MPSEVYEAQVRLLVRVLPFLRDQPHLALKGGTAINLFVQDLPRLSVDIDLAYTGLEGRDEALANIHTALLELKTVLEALGLRIHATPFRGTATWVKLVVSDGEVQVKVEVSPVLRGTVYPPELRQTTPSVQARFGFAEVPVLALPDLYAGKLVAALDRQHPRDLYDVRLFLAQGRLSREVVLAFLVYLVSHGRPMNEVLRPNFKDLSREYTAAFVGMTVEDVSLVALEQAREELLSARALHSGRPGLPAQCGAGAARLDTAPVTRCSGPPGSTLEAAQHRADGPQEAAGSDACLGRGSAGEVSQGFFQGKERCTDARSASTRCHSQAPARFTHGVPLPCPLPAPLRPSA